MKSPRITGNYSGITFEIVQTAIAIPDNENDKEDLVGVILLKSECGIT